MFVHMRCSSAKGRGPGFFAYDVRSNKNVKVHVIQSEVAQEVHQDLMISCAADEL